ncbi:MAG: penicillin-binding protein 2, partial [Pseudomonadota bacterium]
AVGLKQNEKYVASRMDEYQRDHSLYEAFAPLDAPRIALAVIVENAGFGSEAAAPIARRVLDYVLLGQYPSEEDLAAVREGKASAPLGTPRKAEDIPMPQGLDAFGVDVPMPMPTPVPVPASGIQAAPPPRATLPASSASAP